MAETETLWENFAVSNEEGLARLRKALLFSRKQGFTLFFVVCNSGSLRRRLIAELRAKLPTDYTLQEIALTQPDPYLYERLMESLAKPLPEAVFLYGLEEWIPKPKNPLDPEFLVNLNMARNIMVRDVACSLVFWFPEYLYAALRNASPDFASIRSGVFRFEETQSEEESRAQSLETLTMGNYSYGAGLSVEEKRERLSELQTLLEGYRDLPKSKQDLFAEARILNTMGELYYHLAEWSKAESCFHQALAMRQQSLPAGHPSIAQSLNNLAELYRVQERYEKAEPLFKQALAIFQQSLPAGHPDIATSLNNLAELYRVQERYEEAEPLYKSALAIYQQSLPAGHPDIASNLNNLGLLYQNQGRYEKAEPLFKQALAIDQKAYPENHPEIAQSLNNLGLLYKSQGRYEEAEPLYKQALGIMEAALGKEHPHTRTVSENYKRLQELMEPSSL